MFHSWLVGLGLGAVVLTALGWVVKKFFGAAISSYASGLFGDTPDDRRLDEWRSDVRAKANRLIHVSESHDPTEYADRDEMQDRFTSTYSDLDDLLAEAPRLATDEEQRKVREALDECDGIDDQEIKTKWAPINFDDPDEEVTTVGKTEDEIIRDFSAQSDEIASAARDLRDHIEAKQGSGILPLG